MTRIVDSRLGYFILFGFALALYANTLFHGFVLDDEVAISKNDYVQKGLGGIKDIFTHDSFAGYSRIGEGESLLVGGRYRPFSIALFALMHSLFGNNPIPFHLLNIIMFAFASIMLYYFLKLAFTPVSQGNMMAFLITAIYIAHPVHVEVVANIKSLDEILVLLFGIAALYGMLRAYDTGSFIWMGVAIIGIFLACFSKENALTFALLAPLTLWFFRKGTTSKKFSFSLLFLPGVLFFLWVRILVLGETSEGTLMQDPLNYPFLEWTAQGWVACSLETKAATIIYTLGEYLRLIVFPYPLTHDYYPFYIELQSFSSPRVWLSLVSMFALLGLGFWGLLKTKKPGFGILFFFITGIITFNILFPVGVFMAERFLFIPSLGLIAAFVLWLYPWLCKKHLTICALLFSFIILSFSILTIIRNQAWATNESLMLTDIKESSESARLLKSLGVLKLDQALEQNDDSKRREKLLEAKAHLEKAVLLHPTYYDALLASGACHYYLGEYQQSASDYGTALGFYTDDEDSKLGLRYALIAYSQEQWAKGDSSSSVAALVDVWDLKQDTTIASQISVKYLEMGMTEEAHQWKRRASSFGFVVPTIE